jgi:DNA-binding transcriptional regulator YiaG
MLVESTAYRTEPASLLAILTVSFGSENKGTPASELGRLIGVSAQSIYNWEEGKARPQSKYLPAVFALKTLGRRAATAHLEFMAANPDREVA